MIEVRPFEGSPEELSDFAVSTWKASYGGTIPVPNWSADYFRWQLRLHEPDSQRRVVAAYEGSNLAGVIIYCPMDFELHGERLKGTQSSWLSVSPDFRRRGVGKALQAGTVSECREQDIDFQLGYIFHGSSRSIGPRFWQKKQPTDRSVGPNVGFWARVLDPARAIEWNVNGLERVLTRAVAPLIPDPSVRADPKALIRPFETKDAAACVEIANAASQHCELRLVWSPELLSHYLQGFGKCLVLEESGNVTGFIGYHSLIFSGRTNAAVGVIDLLCVSNLSYANRARLLNSVLGELKDEGAVVALKLRTGDYPASLFVKRGWAPRLADSHMLFSWSGEPRNVASIRRCQVLWR